MNSVQKIKSFKFVHPIFTRSASSPCRYRDNSSNKLHFKTLSSKEIRKLFLNYFVQDKNHSFVQSSPVFLNNDPSLLFVNAGMNQFRSLLLSKTYPGHPFHELKRAANTQKCVRLSGKHNDLKDVGADVYHHTFFEMLGSWSFGDYTKLDACKMAWELLTNVYGLNPQNLYVTYFGGDKMLGIMPDEECKENWLEIGIHPNHIFPFGAKDNFWEMGNNGPCGPCTEIHYDFNCAGYENVSQKINAGCPDVMEIWNLVFIQFNREKDGTLKSVPLLNIDTGMGFERLCAVLNGTRSNYDTDIFIPIFEAIQLNFKLRPYGGKTGADDIDGLDTAYRIIADHSRMFSAAIADGLFPDSCDAGHVLRKIIRRAAYTANRDMKTRPGVLSSLVPYVAETLDFFPEINANVKEIISIVDEEEKMFHQVINKGRKARNKMMSNSSGKILDGKNLWELHKVHGLENNVVQDLASEVNLTIDWEDYEAVKKEKIRITKKQQEEIDGISTIAKVLKELSIPFTNDSVKYKYSTDKNNYGVEAISAKILAIFKNTELVSAVENGDQCILVTDKSNFYSEAGGQISGIGRIFNKEFNFKVKHVSTSEGYVFHHGVIDEGRIQQHSDVHMTVEKDHHLECCQNHTATHILNAALRKILPYTVQRSSYVGPTHLRFAFSAKSALSLDQLEEIESYVNQIIQKKMKVLRKEMMFEELVNHPKVILLRGEDYPDIVSVIYIGDERNSELVSIEPCCGTHVYNTEDIGAFCIIPSKSSIGSTKFISAVTGIQALKVGENGKIMQKRINHLENQVIEAINDIQISTDSLNLLLKEIKATLRECQTKTDAPLLDLKKWETILKELKLKVTDFMNTISECDVISNSTDGNSEQAVPVEVMKYLRENNILPSNDAFKYDYCNKEVKPITANILAIFKDNEVVHQIDHGLRCQLIFDNTNFYSSNDDQACDVGIVSCDDFVVKIDCVYKVDVYVFHEGFVEQGNASLKQNVNLSVDKDHRLACSQNHTALHLLNAVMKKELPYFFPVSSNAGTNELQLNFTAKGHITDDQLEIIEKDVNECINAQLNVIRTESSKELLTEFPLYKSALIKKSNECIPVIVINENQCSNLPKSIEPCYGTHVSSTLDIGSFIIISQKNLKDKERVIRAVTGTKATLVKKEGEIYDNKLSQLEQYVLKKFEVRDLDYLQLWDCLKEVKEAKGYHETELPLLLFRSHQNRLSVLTKRLTEATNEFVQKGFIEVKTEMQTVLKGSLEKKFIVHKLESLGDGKKIANYAIENSGNKPALYFAKDGHSSYICSCSVPKSFVHSTFSALLWINPVAAVLDGRARTLAKDTELLYSVITHRIDKIEEAICIATEYALTHLYQ